MYPGYAGPVGFQYSQTFIISSGYQCKDRIRELKRTFKELLFTKRKGEKAGGGDWIQEPDQSAEREDWEGDSVAGPDPQGMI